VGGIVEKVWGGLLKKRAKARFFRDGDHIIYIIDSLYIFVEIIGIKCYNIVN
jgi:hypothetical protein